MGLIQRRIEELGVPTVSVTVARDVTDAVKAPRAIFVPWPMGHHFGVPFHTALQRRVLVEMLSLLQEQAAPQEGFLTRELRIPWAEVRRSAKTITSQGMTL